MTGVVVEPGPCGSKTNGSRVIVKGSGGWKGVSGVVVEGPDG